MDGGDTGIAALVNIWGNCPGLTLQDIKLENYLQYGILVNNCEGSTEKPVRLERPFLQGQGGTTPARSRRVVPVFPGLSVKVNKHITLTDSDFDTSPKVTRPRGMPLDESIKLGAIKVEERQAAERIAPCRCQSGAKASGRRKPTSADPSKPARGHRR